MTTCYGVTPSLRDNEDAYVSVNGKTCWSKTKAVGTSGTQQCGGFFKEERFRVTGCSVTLSGSDANMPLEVRVWTSLDGDPGDESFGIDNVVVRQFQIGKHAGILVRTYRPLLCHYRMLVSFVPVL